MTLRSICPSLGPTAPGSVRECQPLAAYLRDDADREEADVAEDGGTVPFAAAADKVGLLTGWAGESVTYRNSTAHSDDFRPGDRRHRGRRGARRIWGNVRVADLSPASAGADAAVARSGGGSRRSATG